MNHIFHPTYCATIDSGESYITNSLVDLSAWAKRAKAELLLVRRFEEDGSIQIQPVLVYEYNNGRQVRIW